MLEGLALAQLAAASDSYGTYHQLFAAELTRLQIPVTSRVCLSILRREAHAESQRGNTHIYTHTHTHTLLTHAKIHSLTLLLADFPVCWVHFIISVYLIEGWSQRFITYALYKTHIAVLSENKSRLLWQIILLSLKLVQWQDRKYILTQSAAIFRLFFLSWHSRRLFSLSFVKTRSLNKKRIVDI